MVRDESGSNGTIVSWESKERETKAKSKRMTLYKGILIDENQEEDEPQVEPWRILLNLQFTKDTSIGMEALTPRDQP